MTPQEIGARLRAAREALGWSMKRMGEAADISHTQVWNAESGRRTSDDTYAKLATVLGFVYDKQVTLREAQDPPQQVLLTSEEAQLLDLFNSIDEDGRERVLSLLESFVDLSPEAQELMERQAAMMAPAWRQGEETG